MIKLLTRIAYFLLPALLLIGAVTLVGSSPEPVGPEGLKQLASHATTITLDPPNDLNFAGEIVPLHDFDVQERLDKELIRYIYYHSATIMNIKRAARWKEEMIRILKRNNVPEDFFYLCIAESHLTNATSPVGAKGFWQFMPSTAKGYGLEITEQVDERYDPVKATHAACKYIKEAYRKFGNWTLVAASYNMGMGGVQKQLDRQKVNNYYDLYLNQETAAYVFRILAIKSVLEDPSAYGFNIPREQLYSPVRYQTVTVDTTIPNLIEFAQIHGTTYKMLKVMNPWMLKDELVVETDSEGNAKKYKIKIPREAGIPDSAVNEMLPDPVPQDTNMVIVSDSLVGTPDTDSIDSFVPDPVPVPGKPAKDSLKKRRTEKELRKN